MKEIFRRVIDNIKQFKLKNFTISHELLPFQLSFEREARELMDISNLVNAQTKYYDYVRYIEDAIKKSRSNNDEQFRFVIMIDDLDRCSPSKAVEVLESIKVLLDIDGIIYVIALNYHIISRLIEQYYKKELQISDDNALIDGSKYLEKFFQVGFHIPAWSEDKIKDVLKEILSDELAEKSIIAVRDELLEMLKGLLIYTCLGMQ